MPPSAIRGLPPSKRRCQTTHDQAPPLSTGSGFRGLLMMDTEACLKLVKQGRTELGIKDGRKGDY